MLRYHPLRSLMVIYATKHRASGDTAKHVFPKMMPSRGIDLRSAGPGLPPCQHTWQVKVSLRNATGIPHPIAAIGV